MEPKESPSVEELLAYAAVPQALKSLMKTLKAKGIITEAEMARIADDAAEACYEYLEKHDEESACGHVEE